MNLHRLLERMDRFFSTVVVLVYLAGMFLGTATYFAGHDILVLRDFAVFVYFGLAGAVEVHSYLSQRHTRAKYQELQKAPEWDAQHERALREFWIHFTITAFLVAFSMFNSCAFWALSLQPQGLGDWAQVILRGSLIPLFFLCAGFLTPLQADAGIMLRDASSDMLSVTLKATTKQWRRNVRKAARDAVPLGEVAATLMEDAGDDDGARRIRLIGAALSRARGEEPGMPMPSLPHYPTGGGTPVSASLPAPSADTSPGLRSVGTIPRHHSRRAASGLKAPNSKELRKASRLAALEASGFVLLDADPTMTKEQLRKALRCRQEVANGIYTAWEIERRQQARMAQ